MYRLITLLFCSFAFLSGCLKVIPAGSDTHAAFQVFGGEGNDQAIGFVPTADGGFIIGCRSGSFGGTGDLDFVILKADSQGRKEWQKYYGGIYTDDMHGMCAASDGSFYFVGMHSRVDSVSVQLKTSTDMFVVRTNQNGNPYFYSKYQMRASSKDLAIAALEESSGNLLVCGSLGNRKDAILMRINSEGDTLLMRNLRNSAGVKLGEFEAIAQSGGYTYLLCESGPDTLILLQLDANLQYSGKRIMTIKTPLGSVRRLVVAKDGSMFLMANMTQPGGVQKIHIEKVNGLTSPIWTTDIGDTDNVWGRSLRLDLDGNLLACGSCAKGGVNWSGSKEVLLLRVDAATGKKTFEKRMGGTVYAEGVDYMQTVSGKYAFLCNTARVNSSNLDILLGFVDRDGNWILK